MQHAMHATVHVHPFSEKKFAQERAKEQSKQHTAQATTWYEGHTAIGWLEN